MRSSITWIGAAALVVVALAWFWFRPELLLVNTTVQEPLPSPVVMTEGSAAASNIRSFGAFRGLAHETSGTATIYMLPDGTHTLRLSELQTSNGPDVRVYLVSGTDGANDRVIHAGDFIDLGALKGNTGDQNYTLPPDVDVERYQSVSIWCRRFAVNFGAASLTSSARGQFVQPE
jgi:hypothetical protein